MPVHLINKTSDFLIDNSIIKTDGIIKCLKLENKKLGLIKINFVDKDKILSINRDFLNHDYYTDIITFDYSFLNKISGEIFICVPVVKENSIIHSDNNFYSELNRVIIHGILHLIGYSDTSSEEKMIMSEKEDYYQKILKSGN